MGINLRAVRLIATLALLLPGCERGPNGNELVSQTKRILSESHPGCAIDVVFNGIGEGDADNAYAEMHLEAGPENGRRSKDVEVLVSDFESNHWNIHRVGSDQLTEAAIQLCKS